MCSKQNRRFKSNSVQHDYSNKWVIYWIIYLPTKDEFEWMINSNDEFKLILTKDISCKCKCRFGGKNVIQINGEIKNFDVSVQNIMYVKKIIFGVLLHVFAKMENI